MPKTYSKKVKGLDLNKYTEVEIYEMVLNGTLKKFPDNFFNCDEANTYLPKIVRYLIEEKLNWTKEDIKKNLNINTFRNNKLSGLMKIAYNNSPYKALCDAYGDNYIMPWELENVPLDFWKGEEGLKNACKVTKWLIEEKLKWNEDDLRNKLNTYTFRENGLGRMIKICYKGSVYECINSIYPNKFMPWEICDSVSDSYWNEETSELAMRWLIEGRLQWSIEDIKSNLKTQTFIDYGLSGMLQKYFRSSPFNAINSLYPNVIKPWELKKTPSNYWNNETIKLAINWLVYDKLKWSKECAKENLTKDILIQNNLTSITKKLSMKEIKDLID